MKKGAVVMPFFYIAQEVLDGLRRLVGVELEHDWAHARLQLDLRIGGRRGEGKGESEYGQEFFHHADKVKPA
jgi:hypothetical protein